MIGPFQAFVSEETLARLQQLTEQTGRPLAEEVRHAIERHLAQPPRVVAEPLAEATVGQPVRKPSKVNARNAMISPVPGILTGR